MVEIRIWTIGILSILSLLYFVFLHPRLKDLSFRELEEEYPICFTLLGLILTSDVLGVFLILLSFLIE